MRVSNSNRETHRVQKSSKNRFQFANTFFPFLKYLKDSHFSLPPEFSSPFNHLLILSRYDKRLERSHEQQGWLRRFWCPARSWGPRSCRNDQRKQSGRATLRSHLCVCVCVCRCSAVSVVLDEHREANCNPVF